MAGRTAEDGAPTLSASGVGRRGWYVRQAAPDEAAFVAGLWGRYFDVEGVPEVVASGTDPGGATYCNVAVTADGELVGAGVAARGPRKWVKREVGLGDLNLYLDHDNGYLYFGGVRHAWRGDGIGTALMRDRVRWLGLAGARRAFGTAWVREDAPDSRSLFERTGFSRVERIERYWADTEDGRPACPDCEGVCTCDAVLYARALAARGEG